MKRILLAAIMVLGFAGYALADPPSNNTTYYLPDPTTAYNGSITIFDVPVSVNTTANITYSPIPVASSHDDFWSFSTTVMTKLGEAYNDTLLNSYDFSVGTGKLDVLLYTRSSDPDQNKNTGFETAVVNSNNKTGVFEGWWGQNDTNNDGITDSVRGPVTVGQVLTYLHLTDPNNDIPVFMFDLNQNGANPTLTFTGQINLIDPINDTIMHTWSFDNNPQIGGMGVDGDYDPTALVWAPSDMMLSNITGYKNNDKPFNSNLGSGRMDFVAYAPSMDLGNYNASWLFVADFNLSGLNDGGEELFLTNRFIPHNEVPEPASMLLFGMGILGLAAMGKKKVK